MTYYYVILKYNVYLRQTKTSYHEKDSKLAVPDAVCNWNNPC
jgi:hypothetical protein